MRLKLKRTTTGHPYKNTTHYLYNDWSRSIMKKTKFWIVVCVLLIGVATSFYFIGYKVAYDRIEIES